MPYKAICGIYKITNVINNKYYIGSALSIRYRLNTHKRLLRDNKHFNNHLQASYNKHGLSNFVFEQLEVTTKETMIEKEQYWIDQLDATNPKKGYNKRVIASSNLGIKASEETRKKLSIAHIGHKRSAEAQTKISTSQYKPIVQIDLSGNVVAKYPSLKEAVKTIGVHSPGLSMCLGKRMQKTGGYHWCYLEELKDFMLPTRKVQKTTSKEILQFDLDGNLIKEWKSITEAVKHIQGHSSRMTDVLQSNKPYKSYIWKHKKPNYEPQFI